MLYPAELRARVSHALRGLNTRTSANIRRIAKEGSSYPLRPQLASAGTRVLYPVIPGRLHPVRAKRGRMTGSEANPESRVKTSGFRVRRVATPRNNRQKL